MHNASFSLFVLKSSNKTSQVTMQVLSFLLALTSIFINECGAFSATSSPSEAAQLARGRLREALSSIANKITISPEIIVPEPSDPTALLLQNTEVTKLSTTIRSAKGNAVFLSGSVNSLRSFCKEQESARGNFPGPLPIIYCESSYSGDESVEVSDIADAGASGLLYSVLGGEEVSCVGDVDKDVDIKAAFEDALDNGIQLIPEVVLSKDTEWDEEATSSLIDSLTVQCGSEPAAILLSLGSLFEGEDSEKEEESTVDISVPKVAKALSKKIPVLGSVRTNAGGGRIGSAVATLKDCGYTGAALRCDCLPGYRMNPDLEFVGGFWGAAVSDLKSLKSRNFNFRSKVELDVDIPLEWFNYQKDVMESGALGAPGGGKPADLDDANGDYQGF